MSEGWAVAVQFADALGRERALSDAESRLLERAVRQIDRDGGRSRVRYWTPGEDRRLLKALKAKVPVPVIAAELRFSAGAAYSRIARLKRARSAQMRADAKRAKARVG